MNNRVPVIGDIYRDKYGDKPGYPLNQRKIKVTEVLPNGVRGDVTYSMDGTVPRNYRSTIMSFKTLRSGYVLWESADAS